MVERMYGSLEGNPATWIAGHEGWWTPKGKWVKIDSIDVSWNAQVLSEEVFRQKWPDALSSLPSSSERGGKTAPTRGSGPTPASNTKPSLQLPPGAIEVGQDEPGTGFVLGTDNPSTRSSAER